MTKVHLGFLHLPYLYCLPSSSRYFFSQFLLLLLYCYSFVLKTKNVHFRQSLLVLSLSSLVNATNTPPAGTFPHAVRALSIVQAGSPLLLCFSSSLLSIPILWQESHMHSYTEPCPIHSLGSLL